MPVVDEARGSAFVYCHLRGGGGKRHPQGLHRPHIQEAHEQRFDFIEAVILARFLNSGKIQLISQDQLKSR